MSSKIDNRVVQMKFDNNQFQSAVSATSNALDKLKTALKLDGAGKGLKDIADAGKNISLEGLSQGIKSASDKFPAMQAVALGVFATIGSKAVELGTNLVKSLASNVTSAMRDGFSDYNLKLTSVQTIMNATGSSIGKVNSYFKKLDTYADKTVFNLSDMTGAFAKFTNAGVKMKDSVPAIKGVANMTALAGQGADAASIAMYNLSQSIAGGFLTTQDYKSLNLANVATKQFKDYLIQTAVAAGTLKKVGKDNFRVLAGGSKATASSAALFTEHLKDGWATSKVLLKTLGDFGNEETKIGKKALAAAQDVKSLPMMIDTLAAAAGTGWTDTFEIVIGNVTESTELFTFLTNELSKFTAASAAARNAQLRLWKAAGGRDAVISGIKNLFTALERLMAPIAKAWEAVFPPSLGQTLTKLSFAFKNFTQNLLISQDAADNIQFVMTGVFQVFKLFLQILGGLLKIAGHGIASLVNLGSAILSVIGPIVKFIRTLIPVKKGADGATNGITDFFNLLIKFQVFVSGALPNALRSLGKLLDTFLNGGGATVTIEAIRKTIDNLRTTIIALWTTISTGVFVDNPFFGENSWLVNALQVTHAAIVKVIDAFHVFTAGVETAAGGASSVWDAVKAAFGKAWVFIKAIGAGIASVFKGVSAGIDWNTVLATFNTGVLAVVAFYIVKFVKTIANAFKGSFDFIKAFGEVLDKFGDVLESYQKKLKAEALLKIAIAITVLAAGLFILAQIDPKRLISAVTGMAVAFGILLGGMAVLSKLNASVSLKASLALIAVAASMSILATAVKKLGSLNPLQLATGVGALAVMMGLMMGSMKLLSSLQGDMIKGATALFLIATSIQALSVAVIALGFVPIPVLVKGLATVAIMLGLLVSAAVLLSKFAPQMVLSSVGLMAMAAALNMLIVPVLALGLIPWPVLGKGLAILAIMIGGLVLAAQQLNAVSGQMLKAALGMMAMAVAINLLVAPVIILGLIPWPVLATGLMALAGLMLELVIAANAVKQAMPGVAAMIAMAAAILILSFAVKNIASVGMAGVVVALIAIAGAITIMGVAAAILSPLATAMYLVAGAMVVFGIGLALGAAAMLIAAVAMAAMGPALISLVGGLIVFAKNSGVIVGATGPMLLLALALTAFAVASLVAAVGIIALGIALVVLGTGLTLVGATALIGATALVAFTNMMIGLVKFVPQMLALAAGFGLLGAAIVILGVGLLSAALGMLSFATSMTMLAAIGPSLIPMITSLLALIPIALAQFAAGVVQFALIIGGAIPLFVAQFTKLVMSILNALQVLSPKIVQTLLVMLQSMLNGIVAAVPMFVSAAMRLMTGILHGISQRLPALLDAGGDVVVKFIKGIGDQATKVTKAAGDTMLKYINGLTDYIRNNTGRFITAGDNLVRAVVDGVAAAIENSGNLIRYAGQRIGTALINGAKNALGINSPSKVFRDYIMGSVFEGIDRGEGKGSRKAFNSGTRVGEAVLNGTASALSNMHNSILSDMDFTPTIQPVVDLTNVRKNSALVAGMFQAPSLDVTTSYAVASGLALQQRTNEEAAASNEEAGEGGMIGGDTYIQNIYSPKAVSDAEIYRNTKNLISKKKGS